MYARAIEDASARLRALRREEWEDFGVATVALGLAVAATKVHASLAVPLLVGGFAVAALGIRAVWRRWDLVDRLAGERDAYVISEVFAYAAREATMERRHSSAAVIRTWLNDPSPVVETRISTAADELEALASDLDDGELELDPASAVACSRLLSDAGTSPLLNAALPSAELRARVVQIRGGFKRRPLAGRCTERHSSAR